MKIIINRKKFKVLYSVLNVEIIQYFILFYIKNEYVMNYKQMYDVS